MFIIECEKCNTPLIFNNKETSIEYYKDINYMVNDRGDIIDKTLQNYLVYTCPGCGRSEKLTYKNWQLKCRKFIAKEVLQIKKMKLFKNLNPQTLDPDNGISHCGQCTGYGGDGYCLNDIIKQCTIRK